MGEDAPVRINQRLYLQRPRSVSALNSTPLLFSSQLFSILLIKHVWINVGEREKYLKFITNYTYLCAFHQII